MQVPFVQNRFSVIIVALVAGFATACSSSSSSSGGSTATSAEATLLNTANTSINTVGTSGNGVLNGTSSVSASSLHPASLPSSFSTSTVCTHSGDVSTSVFATNTTSGWAIARIYCNFAMRPDGPDTVRGGLDRTAGLLCALGNNITYDGQAHSVSLTFDSTCFSPAMLAIVCGSASSCSGTGSITAYTPTQYTSAGYTAPTGFNKILALTVTVSGSSLYNTIAIADSSTTERGIAINYALPDGSQNKNSVLAVYMNSSTGVVRYEGRFAGNSDYTFRHLRAQINGTVSSADFSLSNITTLQFAEGDNFESPNDSAFYLTLSGAAGSGRVIGYAQNTYSGSAWTGWTTEGDNDVCYPSSATCSSPLAPTGTSDTNFITQSTTAANWFNSNALLSSTATTVPLTDIWN